MSETGVQREGKRSISREQLLASVLVLLILSLLLLFFKDIMIPYIRLEIAGDVNGARELLRDTGLLGFLAVTLVEALQMVVIFIPAEFIQISSGLSYPFWAALVLCDLGVCLGASIIYVLVRIFRYHSEAFEKRRKQIDRLSPALQHRNTVLFMYLLFFMPIIPFGAICYYGSSTDIPYRRYLRTVATGVIPSIVVSNLMGSAGLLFLAYDLPFWLLVLIIILLAAVLFAIIVLFMNKVLFKEGDGTPDSPLYSLVFFAAGIWQGRMPALTIEEDLLKKAEVPYIMLANHQSFFDFLYIRELSHPKNPSFVVNEYYCSRPVLKTLKQKTGIISKKLFTPDIQAPIAIRRMLKAGYPVVIFPEGRLSPDGRTNPIAEEAGAYYKRLGADLVLVKIRGAYFAGPKWRKRRYHREASVSVTVEQVIKKEQLASMSAEELDRLIARTLFQDESAAPLCSYPQQGKARGLENILYRCPDCGELYTLAAEGSSLRCRACGSIHTLDEHYRFTTAPRSIPEWYGRIKDAERAYLEEARKKQAVSTGSRQRPAKEPGPDRPQTGQHQDGQLLNRPLKTESVQPVPEILLLETPVRTVIHNMEGKPSRKEKGRCALSLEFFSYTSQAREFRIPTAKIPALAFSCGTEFELYHEGELYYFYPEEYPAQTARWALIIDLMNETAGAADEVTN